MGTKRNATRSKQKILDETAQMSDRAGLVTGHGAADRNSPRGNRLDDNSRRQGITTGAAHRA